MWPNTWYFGRMRLQTELSNSTQPVRAPLANKSPWPSIIQPKVDNSQTHSYTLANKVEMLKVREEEDGPTGGVWVMRTSTPIGIWFHLSSKCWPLFKLNAQLSKRGCLKIPFYHLILVTQFRDMIWAIGLQQQLKKVKYKTTSESVASAFKKHCLSALRNWVRSPKKSLPYQGVPYILRPNNSTSESSR